MAVISISIEKSLVEIISGIPKTIILSTNIPSTIFYTLDGSDPTLFSEIYTSKIFLPQNSSFLLLKVMASNGVDSSPIITEKYFTSLIGKNIREFGVGTNEPSNNQSKSIFPFGSNSPSYETVFNENVSNHQAISTGEITLFPNGFNADGYPTNFTKLPYTPENYQIRYDQRNRSGRLYGGVGTVPNNSKILLEKEPDDETLQFSRTFDPKAMVIFQNVEDEDPNDPPQINKQFFSLDKLERVKDGANFFIANNETPALSGTFVKAHYNPRTNEMNYYYFDSQNLKWIISKQQYSPSGNDDGNYAGSFLSRGQGVGKVFKWLPFSRRHLF